MACAKGPAEFCPDGDASVVSTSWTAWVEEFEAYADSKGLFNLAGDQHKDMRAQRKALLLYHAGPRVREIQKTLTATNRHAYDNFLTGLNTYFTVEPNETFQRHIFRKMIQEEGETVSQFCSRLRKAASNGCNYHDVDKMIRDQIVEYCISDELRKKLMEEGNGLDLARTLQLAVTHESVDIRFKEMSNRPLINRVGSGSGKHSCSASSCSDNNAGTGNTGSYKGMSKRSGKCDSCGRGGDAIVYCGKCGKNNSHDKCPAFGKQCHKCKGYNHFQAMCRAKNVNTVSGVRDDCTSQSEEGSVTQAPDSYYAFTIHTAPKVDNLERVQVMVGGVNVTAIVDTGADCNVISRVEWERLKQSCVSVVKSEKCDTMVYSYASKTPLRVIGRFWAAISVASSSGVEYLAKFNVIQETSEPLLGIEICKQLGVVEINTGDANQAKVGQCCDNKCVTEMTVAGPVKAKLATQHWLSPCLWAIATLLLVILAVGFDNTTMWPCLKGGCSPQGTMVNRYLDSDTPWVHYDICAVVNDDELQVNCLSCEPMWSTSGSLLSVPKSTPTGILLGVPKGSPSGCLLSVPKSTHAGILFDVPMCASVVGVLGVPWFTTAAYDFGRMVTNMTIGGVTDGSLGNRRSYMDYFVWDSDYERITSNFQSVLLLAEGVPGCDVSAECFGLALGPGTGDSGHLYVQVTCLDRPQKGE